MFCKIIHSYYSFCFKFIKINCLRERGVYDNTRIIIVEDHGRDVGKFGLQFAEEYYGWETWRHQRVWSAVSGQIFQQYCTDYGHPIHDKQRYTSYCFLGVDPVNPFTGNRINCRQNKESTEQHIVQHIISMWNNSGTKPGIRKRHGRGCKQHRMWTNLWGEKDWLKAGLKE